jgi:hypothetical protein
MLFSASVIVPNVAPPGETWTVLFASATFGAAANAARTVLTNSGTSFAAAAGSATSVPVALMLGSSMVFSPSILSLGT